jgi:hypothetical protein
MLKVSLENLTMALRNAQSLETIQDLGIISVSSSPKDLTKTLLGMMGVAAGTLLKLSTFRGRQQSKCSTSRWKHRPRNISSSIRKTDQLGVKTKALSKTFTSITKANKG